MKSLILFLFLGATVALAEIHVGNDPNREQHRKVLKECMEKCRRKPTIPGELADEENDPYRHHRRFFFSSEVKKCIRECLEKHKPSKLPPPPTEPGKVADEDKECAIPLCD